MAQTPASPCPPALALLKTELLSACRSAWAPPAHIKQSLGPEDFGGHKACAQKRELEEGRNRGPTGSPLARGKGHSSRRRAAPGNGGAPAAEAGCAAPRSASNLLQEPEASVSSFAQR